MEISLPGPTRGKGRQISKKELAGMSGLFYQTYWDTGGDDVVATI